MSVFFLFIQQAKSEMYINKMNVIFIENTREKSNVFILQ